MTRAPTEQAEIAGGFLQSFAEVPLPDSVHGNAGEQRVLLIRQPADKALAQAIAELLHPTGDIAHRLGNALGAEQQHDGCQDDDPVEKAERTHKLVSSP